MRYKETWDGEFLKSVLQEFQKEYYGKIYKERIPYDTWRCLMKLPKVEVEFDVTTAFFYTRNKDGHRHKIYCPVCTDNGFGRFFYRKFIEEEHPMVNLHTGISALDSVDAASVTYAGDPVYNTVDAAVTNSSYTYDTNSVTICGDSLNSWSDKTATISIPSDYGRTSIGSIGIDIPNIPLDWDRVASKSELDNIEKTVKELQKTINMKKEENKTMKGFNFDFGPCGSTVRLSMYGMAIQNVANEWVSYNPDSKEIINVDVLNIPDGGKYMYKMPVAISDVKVGDVVIHNRVPMFVTAITETGFKVTDVRAGETKDIIPTRNMFGFNFMTKVVSLFNAFTNAPTADQPFGNMLPFLMMGEGKDMDPMMLMCLMNGGALNTSANGMNPMMMYFLMKDNKDMDPMMLMMLMGGMGCVQHSCDCHSQG